MNTTHRNITADEDLELRMTTAVSQNPNDQGRSSCALAESSSTHRPPAPTSTPTAQCTATPANTSSDSQPFPTLSTHPDDAPEQTRSSSKEEDHGEHPHAQRPSLLRRATHRLPQPDLILLNSGSVARDHLASERTFLAYVRTSLTLVTMGVALVQLLLMSGSSLPSSNGRHTLSPRIRAAVPALGAVIIALGMGILFIGFSRYFTIQSSLTKGKFPAARLGVVLMSGVVGAVVVVVFGFLIGGST